MYYIEDIKRDSRIEEEYNSILNDMNSQSNNYISNIFQKETNKGKNIKCIYDNMNLQNKEALEKELRVEITKENYLLDSLNIK